MTVLGDRESLMVSALKSRTAVTLLTTAVSTSLQAGLTIRVTVIGGGPRATTNTGRPTYQLECWGAGVNSRAEAAQLAAVVEHELESGITGTFPAGNVVGSWVVGDVYASPDPTTSRARYIVTGGLLIQP